MLKKKLLPLHTDTMRILVRTSKFSKSEEVQFRLRVTEFSKKYGIKAAQDAFGVSRATVGRCKGGVQKNHREGLIVSSPSISTSTIGKVIKRYGKITILLS